MVHGRRVAPTLPWLDAFLSSARGPLVRKFRAHARRVPTVWTIATDASPWGTGAVLAGPRGIVEYFGAPATLGDLQRFQAATGDPAYNTPWGALAVL
eukprot:2511823-Alexandrium_andersonii.AAC.1